MPDGSAGANPEAQVGSQVERRRGQVDVRHRARLAHDRFQPRDLARDAGDDVRHAQRLERDLGDPAAENAQRDLAAPSLRILDRDRSPTDGVQRQRRRERTPGARHAMHQQPRLACAKQALHQAARPQLGAKLVVRQHRFARRRVRRRHAASHHREPRHARTAFTMRFQPATRSTIARSGRSGSGSSSDVSCRCMMTTSWNAANSARTRSRV